MNPSRSLTEGSISKGLLLFSVPFLLSYILQGLYSNVDVMIIGNFCDAAALSAVATGGTIMMALNSLVMGLGDGVTVLVGQYFGAKQEENIRKSIGTSFVVCAAVTFGMLVILQALADPILDLMLVPAEARTGALAYTRICYVGLLFTGGYNVTSGVLRGMGDSKRPLLFVSISCVLNIILDIVFVGGIHMGAAGAALATVMAQAISFIISIFYLRSKKDFCFDYSLQSFRPYRDKAVSLARFGAPIALQNFLASASFLVMIAIFNNMGVTESATVGVTDKLACFGQYPAMAFSAALAAFAAQNVGARQMKRAGKGCRFTVILSVIIGGAYALLLLLFPAQLVSLYTNDQAVIALGWQYLYPYAAEGLLVSYVFCISGFFNGCGHTTASMAAHLIATFAGRVPLLLLFGCRPGATLLLVASACPISSFIQLLILTGYLISGRWKIPKSVVD